jgi:hypothetical protein
MENRKEGREKMIAIPNAGLVYMRFPLVLLSVLLFLGGAGEARASLTFSETFLGGKTDGVYFDVWQNWNAKFIFNMTTSGETATLYDNHNNQVGLPLPPSLDETRFVPNVHRVDAATLGFTFSSSDPQPETVLVRTGFWDGNTLLREETYNLGNYWTLLTGNRKSADLTLDLVGLNLRQYLEDGRFVTLVIAPDLSRCISTNDFRIDTANLTVEATPVPIPASVWLFGSGFVGLIGIGRKVRRGNSSNLHIPVIRR